MSITPAQLDAHLKSMKGKYNLWSGIPGAQCMVIFASVNKRIGGPAYSAPGAKDLWNNPALAAGYTQLSAGTTPRFGDIAIRDGSWGDGWGHVSVVVAPVNANSNREFGQNPGAAATTVLGKNGLLGYLRPKALTSAAPAPKPKPNPVAGPTGWTVDPGDTMTAIAKKSGVTLDALIKANPGINPDRIAIGQKLKLPAGARW